MARPSGAMRRRNRSTWTSRAFRPGAPSGHPAAANCARDTTVSRRSMRAATTRASTGGRATQPSPQRTTPSASIVGLVGAIVTARRPSVPSRASMSPSAAGRRTQSSRGSRHTGGGADAETRRSRGRPASANRTRRCSPEGQSTTSTVGISPVRPPDGRRPGAAWGAGTSAASLSAHCVGRARSSMPERYEAVVSRGFPVSERVGTQPEQRTHRRRRLHPWPPRTISPTSPTFPS